MRIINLGILAHVDAGKTSLTERLLFEAGVIDRIGSVDAGTTQTDTLALERQRGITIKSAVASFAVGDVTVNLIDTPGHPDFIAEVERVLGVLDGAVLVISAVEGVQAQTRVLLRALRRLQVPTLLFVNKIDRRGADFERVLAQIARTLTPDIVALDTLRAAGTADAEPLPFDPQDAAFRARLLDRLTAHDDTLLAAYLADEADLSAACLWDALAAQTARVHPVVAGSAITGAGVAALIAAVTTLLPAASTAADRPAAGTVFKIERGAGREKIAYVRMHAGTIRVRDRLRFGDGQAGKVTAIQVFDGGPATPRPALAAGQIGKLWGLGAARIGDVIGTRPDAALEQAFAPPTLETVVVPCRPAERGALHQALSELAEQDPLINLRQDEHRLLLSLYGEVQKEVIQETLRSDFRIDVGFAETTTICVERPAGSGAGLDLLGKGGNPFLATVGLRIDPAPAGSGLTFRLAARLETLPLYVYKSVEAFEQAMTETVREALGQGLAGWQVTDCSVTLTDSGYSSPVTGARDFRLLTPLVLMQALAEAGTVVCAPLHRIRLEIPPEALGRVVAALGGLGATLQTATADGTITVLEGTIAAARVHELQRQLPGLTRGEGVLESAFERYEPATGSPPTRPRPEHHPLNREAYLLHLARKR